MSTKLPISQNDISTAADNIQNLYRAYWQELCNYLVKKFGAGPPEPEDIAQTAFIRLVSARQTQTVQNQRAFLYTTANNLVMDYHRREKRHRNYAADITLQAEDKKIDGFSPERVLIGRERVKIMEQTIRRLPKQQREVVILHRIHDLNYTQIAARMGMSESTVRRLVVSAVEKIEAALERAAAHNAGNL